MSRLKKPAKPPVPQPDGVERIDQPEESDHYGVMAQWEGPLPPPSIVKAFDEVVEHGAERIFRMAEKEQEHRHLMERTAAETESKAFSRGQVFGFAVSFASIVGAVAAAALHAPVAVPVALVGIPMAGVVKAFLATRATTTEEAPKKTKRG